MKILFMGTPDYAKTILQSLIDKYEIVGVYTQPDKIVGRKRVLTSPLVKILAENNNLPVFQPNNLNNEIENIKELNPDFIVVAAFGQILPKEILEIAPCINLHASLLPKYRGASPIQTAILNGDTWTGVTAMKMDIGLDTGDILAYQYCEVKDKNAPQLFDELALIASELTLFVIENYKKIVPLKQNNAISTYSPKITKKDGEIFFDDALKIAKLIQKNYGDFYILGFSIGSSVASFVASKVDVLGLFLVGVFDSIAGLAKRKYGVGFSWLYRYRFETFRFVQNVNAKTYIFVSVDDELTYIENARELKKHVKNLEFYKELEGLSHKELLWHVEARDKIVPLIFIIFLVLNLCHKYKLCEEWLVLCNFGMMLNI